MNAELKIVYPESLPDALQQTRSEFEEEARAAMAVKLYELGRLSSGQAALLAGLDRVTFLLRLADYGVAIVPSPSQRLRKGVPITGFLSIGVM